MLIDAMTLPKEPGLYRIEDVATGRFYVGSSVNIENRWKQHAYRLQRGDHPNPIIQAIWNADKSRLRVTCTHLLPGARREEILAAEQRELDAAGVGANCACMNVLAVAGSHLGRKRSEETKAKLAASQRGKMTSDASKAKMRAAKLGRPLSAEHRKKLGDVARGRKINRPKGIYCLHQRALTADQVRALRAWHEKGWSIAQLTTLSGLKSAAAVWRAVTGHTYQDVKPC